MAQYGIYGDLIITYPKPYAIFYVLKEDYTWSWRIFFEKYFIISYLIGQVLIEEAGPIQFIMKYNDERNESILQYEWYS